MSAFHLPPCAENISEQTLSDWHDGLLSAAEARHLRHHMERCVACRYRAQGLATVAITLRRQHIPNLQRRIWRGMLERMQRKPANILQRSAVLSIVSAVVVIALAAFFFFAPKHSTMPPTSFIPTATRASTATAQPTATPQTLTPAQAWGTAGVRVLNIDTKKYFIQGLLPGGAGVVATTFATFSQTNPQDITVSVVLITAPDARVQTLATGHWTHASVATDGRYIAWVGGYNPTGGPGDSYQTLAYDDLSTGQIHTLFDGEDNRYLPDSLVVTHGHICLIENSVNPPQSRLLIFDIASGAQTTPLNNVERFSISWPYVLSAEEGNGQIKGAPNPMTLVNVVTGQQRDVTSLVDYFNGISPNFALDGTTIFATRPDDTHTIEKYYEIDHADQPAPPQRVLFSEPLRSYPSIDDAFTGADARLLSVNSESLGFSIWDRVLHHPISTGTFFMFNNGVVAYSTSPGQPQTLVLQAESNFAS